MIVIGLTGNIGSGKSTVARQLKNLGAKIIDADQVARQVVTPGSPGLQEIVNVFGPGVLDSAGKLDRKKMGSLVFANPQARERLNKITHPKIKQEIEREIDLFNKGNKTSPKNRVLVIDAPLLIEVGLEHNVDEIWVVKVNQEEQIERLAKRDGMTSKEALRRIAAQLPQEDKIKHAARVIDNSGSKDETIKQVDRHWEQMMKEHLSETAGI
ncbi:dephospho-CoA kinase [Pelotomaculum propionicicum]|uniref:dephospho-CoA kinase n=1 Tax=Pelotomaculum propionicicum TaxID=258475 RepID=UPI003B7FA462